MNHTNNRNNPPEIYATTGVDQLYSPFSLHIDPMERLLLVNFEQDPDEIYVGFEPQQMTPGGGWQPNQSKWSVRFIYWMASNFKQWPKTYLWMASLDLADPQQVTMQSGWQRIE